MSKRESIVMTACFSGKPSHPITSLRGGGLRANRPEQLRDLNLTSTQYRILGIVAASCGAPISKSYVAEIAHCTVRTIDRAIHALADAGLVRIDFNYDESGAQIGNSYRLSNRQERAACARIRPDP